MARLVTWNMQGSKWGDGAGSSPWDELKPWFRRDPFGDWVEVACLQECGGLPPTATRIGGPWVSFRPLPPGLRRSARNPLHVSPVDRVELNMYEWRPYRDTTLYILYYQTPPSGYSEENSKFKAGRVNLAVVSREQNHYVQVIFNRLPIRPLIGSRINGVYFFTIHAAASSRGSDAPDLLGAVQAQIAPPWWVAGDYNQAPEELKGKLEKTRVLPRVTVCQPDWFTHVSRESGYSMLTIAVRSWAPPQAPGGKVLPLAGTGRISDHSPVFYPL